MLERLGQAASRVASVDNGAKALAEVLKGGCDVVLMDVQMPEMDGMEATRRIVAALLPERRPYIVAMTANAMAGDREACLEAGMDDYIAKPIQLKTLAEALSRAAHAVQGRVRARAQQAGDAAAADPSLAPAPAEGDNPGLSSPPGKPMTAEDVLDMSQIEELISLDETRAVLAEFVGMFVTQAPERIAEIRSALERGDFERMAAVAHSLKGASGNLGAKEVAEISRRLEHAGRAVQGGHAAAGSEMQADLTELEAGYKRAETALKSLLPA
jgi:CheY-like chemotaxis protein/HPt (histidine-containing phosphotransfer) domain-containing protein